MQKQVKQMTEQLQTHACKLNNNVKVEAPAALSQPPQPQHPQPPQEPQQNQQNQPQLQQHQQQQQQQQTLHRPLQPSNTTSQLPSKRSRKEREPSTSENIPTLILDADISIVKQRRSKRKRRVSSRILL